MPNVKVKENETILDVAVLQSGSFESIYELALLNNLALTADLSSGQLLTTGTILDDKVIAELQVRKARPASAFAASDIRPEGISYWKINVDFIVQ